MKRPMTWLKGRNFRVTRFGGICTKSGHFRSKANLLENDGLTTLEYKKLNEKDTDLYKWLLVRVPEAPPALEKSIWNKMSDSWWSGVNTFADKVNKNVMKSKVKKKEQEKRHGNKVY